MRSQSILITMRQLLRYADVGIRMAKLKVKVYTQFDIFKASKVITIQANFSLKHKFDK